MPLEKDGLEMKEDSGVDWNFLLTADSLLPQVQVN